MAHSDAQTAGATFRRRKMYRAAVVGAGGYAGIEVVRTLILHPEFELVATSSDSLEGERIASVYPALEGYTDLKFVKSDENAIASEADIVFLAVPHTAAMACAPAYLERGVAVVDLSADYRIHDKDVYAKWYGVEHTSPELLAKAVYGQPETHRGGLQALGRAWDKSDPSTTPLVACAGCYPTATILASMPALEAGLDLDGYVVVNALSGVSGAGKKANARTHFCHANESVQAYSAGKHRHTPEIEQELAEAAGHQVRIAFSPILAPMKRGLLSMANIRLSADATFEQALDVYEKRYAEERFTHFLGAEMPQTASVNGGNHAHVGLAFDEGTHTLIASAAIDNLDKGAATQAVQCANLICGLDESAGLEFASPAV